MPGSVLNVGNKHTYLIGKLIFFFLECIIP